ncbi:hypothetical protein BBO99_00009210 [Phytophthora kernoviae]|uniref:AAA+ ATPase domain-containing protein n=2 Tax=Phytophthora kernoviae TaxID=325452 RepID=A0A3R7G257_9STRA|nr:hypothetical protein G195_010779 [Phytophthora kernoviae 00238/432]KAG2506946.1 hypothetical protein JM16_009085 [Phytophthora kernoviae]KAG2508770.1 hypothetical protein JM18_009103 [Phytophthora kernoviae]RLN20190.1 hypothetical protein BBI17_009227 [Phytophthora kernoviae]RLN73848.1 hypothetical protein BBO99_00009210 [Phytophthora kernoviae]
MGHPKTGARGLRFFLGSMLLRLRTLTAADSPAPSPWRLFSVFLGDLRDKRVGKVLLAGDHCIVQAKEGVEKYKVLVPPRTENTYILDALVHSGVEFGSVSPSTSSRLMPVALALLPFLYLGLTYRMLRSMYSTDTGAVGKDGTKKVRKQQQAQHISFDDVAGIDVARKELEEVVDFLRNPARYQAIGAKVPKGVMLCGPSGTGKTLLARAVASEAGVAFLFCSASDFVEMLVGRGAARVRDLFTQASQYPQCIIFIDEIDALAKARGGFNSNDEREQTLNQLLTEMDGFEGNANGVIVIAATNRPEVLDPALCRPGRFDRHVYVGLPDAKGREAILEVHCRNVRLDDDVNLSVVAEECGQMGQRSGAQLASLVNEAALLAVRHGDTTVKHAHLELAMNRAFESQTRSIAGSSFEFAMDES